MNLKLGKNMLIQIKLNTNIETYDFTVNATLSNKDTTTYFCQMFKLPSDWLNRKRHLIRVF